MSADDQLRTAIGNLGTNEVYSFFNALSLWVTVFGLAAGAVAFMIGGYVLLSAAGNEQKVSQGKKTIAWAAAGVAVIVVARGIVAVIGNFFS